MTSLAALGDRAFLASFAMESEAASWAKLVREQSCEGILDVVLAYRTVAVFADPDRLDLEDLESHLRQLSRVEPESSAASTPTGKLIRLPVLYDGDDLIEVAHRLGLTPAEVVKCHSSQEYAVYAIGFHPGFPYAGYLPEPLRGLPRRESPRLKVPAGSVAIVGRQTGVYPEPSPGGWHLIGRTPLRIVDLEQRAFPIRSGDRIRFDPIDAQAYQVKRGEFL